MHRHVQWYQYCENICYCAQTKWRSEQNHGLILKLKSFTAALFLLCVCWNSTDTEQMLAKVQEFITSLSNFTDGENQRLSEEVRTNRLQSDCKNSGFSYSRCHLRKCLELLYELQGGGALWVHRKCIWMTTTKDCTSVLLYWSTFLNVSHPFKLSIWCDPIFNR